MKIKVGDTVETLDDDITGKVIEVSENTITIESNDGFEFQFQPSELIVIQPNESIDFSSLDQNLADIKLEKSVSKRNNRAVPKAKERHRPTFVVDLHIHQLTDSSKGMTNFDMLNLQLDTARNQLEFAIKKRIPKMVFVHGVGAGVLKQELHTILRRYNSVQFYDANYKTFGLGATEVKIFQNIAP